MKHILLFGCLLFMPACMTMRTQYAPHGASGGYSEQMMGEKLGVARFSANTMTDSNLANLFSRLRATELCQQQGGKVPRVLGVLDQTTQQTVQKTSAYSYSDPQTYSGTSNTMFNGFGMANTMTSGTLSGGSSYGGSTTWNETYSFPAYDTYYHCVARAWDLNVQFRPVSENDMKPYTKDLMAGLQIESIPSESPNQGILSTGDIVIKVDGVRVKNISELVSSVDQAKNKKGIPILLVREGQQMTVRARAEEITKEITEQTEKLLAWGCTVPEVAERPFCISRTTASKKQE